MLEELRRVASLDDITTLGFAFLRDNRRKELQDDLRASRTVFRSSDYWTQDMISQYTGTEGDVARALSFTVKESPDTGMLHRLQLFIACCPAVAPAIIPLLKKSTI